MMRYLRLNSFCCISVLLLLCACGNPYRSLQQSEKQYPSALTYKPVFEKKLYRCTVNGKFLFKKFHLSGVLFFKEMPEHATRAVFQNEMGFPFFDFEWNKNDSFTVKQIIPQLDKPPVIKILRKDMELLLMRHLATSTEKTFTKKDEIYHRFDLEKGYAYYIFTSEKLVRIENAGKKKVTTLTLADKTTAKAMPDSVFIKHHKAHFTIALKTIEQHADE